MLDSNEFVLIIVTNFHGLINNISTSLQSSGRGSFEAKVWSESAEIWEVAAVAWRLGPGDSTVVARTWRLERSGSDLAARA